MILGQYLRDAVLNQHEWQAHLQYSSRGAIARCRAWYRNRSISSRYSAHIYDLRAWAAVGHTNVRLSQYLCTCNDCPRAKAIHSALRRLHPKLSSDKGSPEHREALLRVLRGCATYDETEPLTPELFFVAQRLLLESSGDEDVTFRHLVAKFYQ
ncbi:hypothetical protein Gpo141_00006410 [Globisporangium polare]